MKQPALIPTLLALSFAVGASMAFAPGCGAGPAPAQTGGSGGTGGGTGGMPTTGGSSESTTTTNNVQCDMLCAHLDQIACTLLQNCAVDCPNHLNAPDDCVDEADALIGCWVEHLQEFACNQDGAIPPAACVEVETAYNACVGGGGVPDASCLCSPGVGAKDDDSCSRKATCGATQYNQTCQKVADGQPWTCTCLYNGGLLGTCSEPEEFEHCSNDYGCCVPLFCAAGSQ
jgi:hypothetical protein